MEDVLTFSFHLKEIHNDYLIVIINMSAISTHSDFHQPCENHVGICADLKKVRNYESSL